jgi:FMN-dependent NADH-azoreductase
VAGEPNDEAEQVTPVLRQALGFMGIHDVNVVRAGGSLAVNLGKVRIEDHLAQYESAIATAASADQSIQ